ncbi:MAG TPA: UPF0182 family protein [Gemmatimonadaceae bacterium]|nr:UPF0182 family protein [Gemmatimonadaceae bacterium]
MRSRHPVLLTLAGAGVLLVAIRTAAAIWTGRAWYAAMGALELWRLKASSVLLLSGVSGAIAAAFVFANLYAVRRSVISLVLPRRVANIEIGEEVPGRYLVATAAVLAVALGALLAIPPDRWTTLALARIGVPFHESDPRFQQDFGFWVYWLPLERLIHLRALLVVIVTAIVVTLLYALTPSLRVGRSGFYASQYVRRHWVVLGAVLLLLVAWSYRLDAYGVLLNGTGAGGVVSAIDENARIPVYTWLAILTMGAALVALWFGLTGQIGVAITAVATVLVISLALRHAAPLVVERMGVESADQRDAPYVQAQAAYTRRAFGVLELPALGADGASGTLQPAAALALPDSLATAAGAIPLWDAAALERAVTLTRSSAGAVRSIAWDARSDGLAALLLQSPPAARPEAAAPAWLVTRVDVADATRGRTSSPSGASAAIGEESVTARLLVVDSAPAVRYAIVADSAGAVVAPSLSATLSRLAYAWSLQNVRLLLRDLPMPDPRVVTRRGAAERVAALTPFFSLGGPHAVMLDDTVLWVVDLYAASETFPIAAAIAAAGSDVRYMRHAAVAIVNSATGAVMLVRDRELDPIAESWARVLPHLFVDQTSLRPRTAAALPPPAGSAAVVAEVMARAGRTPARVAAGHVPWNDGSDSTVASAEEPPLMLLTGGVPVTADVRPVLSERDSVVGAVAAIGGPRRGVVWIPFDPPATRWAVVVDRLRRALDSAAVIPGDVRLVRGAIRVIPLRRGVAFVQPAYAWPSAEPPTLAAVAVLTGDSVRAGPTLLAAIRGTAGSASASTPASGAPADFRERVTALYERMRAAMRRGDWVEFGRAYEALGRELGRAP